MRYVLAPLSHENSQVLGEVIASSSLSQKRSTVQRLISYTTLVLVVHTDIVCVLYQLEMPS